VNKKLIAFLSILSLLLSIPFIPANAAAKAGAKCNKAGFIEVVKGKSYTCVKTGKKLVWNKGVTVEKLTPTATPTATPTPTPTATPTATPTPSPKPSMTSLDPRNPKLSGRDLCETQSPGTVNKLGPSTTQSPSASYGTLWEKYKVIKPTNGDAVNLIVKSSYAKSTAGNSRKVPAIDFYIDPELLNDVNLTKQLEGINRAWQSSSQLLKSDFKKPISIVLFSDWEWLKKIHLESGCSLESASTRSSNSMNFASGWASQDILTLYFNYSGDKRSTFTNGSPGYLAAHELFHLIQFQNVTRTASMKIPNWFVEGGATGMSPLALGVNSGFLNNGNYLSFINDAKNTLEDSQAFYQLGYVGWEFLIYTIGFDNQMNIWEELARGKIFSQAFLDATNIELKDFYKMFEEIRPDIGIPINK
jgi:hypothetical protein